MRPFSLLLVLAFCGIAYSSDCRYQVYTPEFVQSRLAFNLSDEGFAVVPAIEALGGEVSANDLAIVNGDRVHGLVKIQSAEDGHDEQHLLRVFSMGRRHLLTVHEKQFHSSFVTQISHDASAKIFDLRAQWTRGLGPAFFVDAERTIPYFFKVEFDRVWKIVLKTLISDQVTVAIKAKMPWDRFWFLVGATNELAPYRRHVVVKREGERYRVGGRVGSHAAHAALVRLALYELKTLSGFKVIIDERIRVAPISPSTCN